MGFMQRYKRILQGVGMYAPKMENPVASKSKLKWTLYRLYKGD